MLFIEIRHEPTEADERVAYDRIYAGQGICLRESFYRWFLEQVPCRTGRLLDVSCGEGMLLRLARQAGFTAIGIDFSYRALGTAQRLATGAKLMQANAQALPFAAHSFDCVTNIGSLEHYFDPAAGVREMARVLRSGGAASVLVPNTFSLIGNIQHVLRYGEVFDDGQPLQRYGTRRTWERLLVDNGLQVTHVGAWDREAPRTLPDLLWLLPRPSKLVRTLISPLIPVNLGNHLLFICTKSE